MVAVIDLVGQVAGVDRGDSPPLWAVLVAGAVITVFVIRNLRRR